MLVYGLGPQSGHLMDGIIELHLINITMVFPFFLSFFNSRHLNDGQRQRRHSLK